MNWKINIINEFNFYDVKLTISYWTIIKLVIWKNAHEITKIEKFSINVKN